VAEVVADVLTEAVIDGVVVEPAFEADETKPKKPQRRSRTSKRPSAGRSDALPKTPP
jgi:hypothetical protein